MAKQRGKRACLQEVFLTKTQYFLDEGRRIRQLFQTGFVDLSVSKHARLEMKHDDLKIEDIVCVLKRCSVINLEGAGEDTCYTAEGTTSDAVLINVVIKMKEVERNVFVVTVFAVRR